MQVAASNQNIFTTMLIRKKKINDQLIIKPNKECKCIKRTLCIHLHIFITYNYIKSNKLYKNADML